jgi:hypothetical protein
MMDGEVLASSQIIEFLPLGPGLVVFLLVLFGLWRSRREEAQLGKIEAQPLQEPLTVIIPARNEEIRLEPTLHALLDETSEGLRVIVYDDRSTDGTAQMVARLQKEDHRLELIGGQEDLQGRFGKPVALAHAIEISAPQSRLVLCLDADVLLAPGCLGGLCEFQKKRTGAVSGCPDLICKSLAEQCFVPAFVALVAAKYQPSAVHDPKSKTAFLNGQLILFEPRDLEKAGGFMAVADTVLEDVAMACRLKETGCRLTLADLRGLASTRMYCTWKEIQEGFGKNANPLYGGPLPTFIMGLMAFLVSIGTTVGLVGAVFVASPWVMAGCLGLFLLVMLIQMRMRQRMQVPAWPVFLLPLVYAGVFWVFALAALRGMTGGQVTWKGRGYPANR